MSRSQTTLDLAEQVSESPRNPVEWRAPDAQVFFSRFAICLCQIALVAFALWGFWTLAKELDAADATYGLLQVALVFIALACLCFAVSLWIRLWTTSTPPSPFPFIGIAVVPVLIAWTMVSVFPAHTYTQRPIETLREMTSR